MLRGKYTPLVMADEVLSVRDDGAITLVVPLTIWRGATWALDRGKFSMLLGLTVITAYPGIQYHKKQAKSVSTGG